ncbi:MAG TPA: hypothetical protein VMS37_29985 [Verrucomicrobiae bacterium]|nr:hypothetical protein [Verrucomicrobiae bacterium]
MRPAFRSALASHGVPAAELETTADRVPIAGVIDDRVVNARVDRTFVDSDGTRWIIDYKTSFHEGSPRGTVFSASGRLARAGENVRGGMTAMEADFNREAD